jgi:hypothetical protein
VGVAAHPIERGTDHRLRDVRIDSVELEPHAEQAAVAVVLRSGECERPVAFVRTVELAECRRERSDDPHREHCAERLLTGFERLVHAVLDGHHDLRHRAVAVASTGGEDRDRLAFGL